MDKKKTICHLTSVHPPFDIRIFYKECVSLAKAGYTVKLIAPIKNNQQKDGVEIIPIKLPTSRLKRMLVVTFRMYFLAMKAKSKVYHFHDPELMICGILLRISGKKVIFDIHENIRLSLVSKDWIPKFLRSSAAFLYFIFERIALVFFNKLILAEESYQRYYPSKKAVVVLNFPLLNEPNIKNREFLSPFVFVYSGVVHPLRGIWEMLEIIKQLNRLKHNVILNLIGELRPQNLHNEILKFIQENNLEAHINIYGKVDYAEISGLLSKADIGFSILKPIPNYKESLPTKIFEYMQHGLPIIANNFPLYKHYVEDTHCGICIDINDIERTVGSIESLLNNRERLMQMSANGKSFIEREFNWNSQKIKLLEVYSSM